jgi:hypothetical protein
MSAEWKPGWIASLAQITPPTGISPWPGGQASGMTAPATTVGKAHQAKDHLFESLDVCSLIWRLRADVEATFHVAVNFHVTEGGTHWRSRRSSEARVLLLLLRCCDMPLQTISPR